MKWLLPNAPMRSQVEATRRLEQRDSLALFMDMGLGKTWTVFNQILVREIDRTVVACPPYLLSNWADEFDKSGMSTMNVGMTVHPDPVPKGTLGRPHIHVVNNQQLRTPNYDNLERFLEEGVACFVGDESQEYKNYQSIISRKAMMLARMAKHRYILTGTPWERVTDLWPQLRIINGISGMSPVAFRGRFAKMGGYKGKQVVGVANHEELKTILAECAFEASEEEYADLPEKRERTIGYQMTGPQARAYRSMVEERLMTIENDGTDVSAEMAITVLTKLQQIACGFVIDNDGQSHDLMPLAENPRINAVKEQVAAVHGKVLIACRFVRSVDHLLTAFPGAAFLRGNMTRDEVKAQKDRFNKDPECRVMVGQSSVTKSGHTLIGEAGDNRCHTLVFYENEFSSIVRRQMEKRPHRQGQDMPVTYVDIVASSIDTKTIGALRKKRDIVREVMGW